ncbi:MAG: Transposase IS200 like protein [Bacteroidetes bacterium ADurb.BinA261]|jgi:REP element-mobilizing transposase RayT|nr:transposase [Dysgonamonadaceae bacterium]OPZ12053.1 MAG: Transposase IS200 like protein [Bacteroidetes bacterium ADurb.BinA261]
MEDEHIYKRHNKTLLLYHIVLPIKYRRKVITDIIGRSLKSICLEISERYEINFIEVGYYATTVGLYGSRDVIMAYVSNQGNEKKYKKLYDGQLSVFD